ncbi:MAG TPA: hypothetical protein PLG77_16770, partial [Burkholderiaceae bacterium]|nr:hypothetical protein [Burkholderiaceae bacterium]
ALSACWGLVAPAGTPPAVVAVLSDAAMKSPWKRQLTAADSHESRVDTDVPGSVRTHLSGDCATHSPAPRSTRHAALLLLAGTSPQRRRALPGTPITALASAFNCRFQDDSTRGRDAGLQPACTALDLDRPMPGRPAARTGRVTARRRGAC